MDTRTEVQRLLAGHHYRLAGIVSRAQGGDRRYGCHTGMRSTRDQAEAEFIAGWDECDKAIRSYTGSLGA